MFINTNIKITAIVALVFPVMFNAFLTKDYDIFHFVYVLKCSHLNQYMHIDLQDLSNKSRKNELLKSFALRPLSSPLLANRVAV